MGTSKNLRSDFKQHTTTTYQKELFSYAKSSNRYNHTKPNPRIIKDDKFKKLVKSIQEFPQMLELRPIVVDGNMVVLGGNMRLKACIAAGLKEVPIIVADQLTDAQKAEFIIKDNVGFGEWDWDLLANQWDVEALEDWGLELPFDNTPVIEAEDETDLSDKIKSAFRIEIELENEEEQEKMYNQLISDGYKCRVLTL